MVSTRISTSQNVTSTRCTRSSRTWLSHGLVGGTVFLFLALIAVVLRTDSFFLFSISFYCINSASFIMHTDSIMLSLFVLSGSALAKGGRGGGGGSVDTSGGDSSGSSGSGDSDSGGGYVYTPPKTCDESACACNNIDGRIRMYELPGSYYNGTITITHQLKANSAWTPSKPPGQTCENNDAGIKTYSYPGLLEVAANGNTSDTNSIFWILRGFKPYEPDKDVAGLDVLQEWLHLRSADWVLGDVFRTSYHSIDETGEYTSTRTYWSTKVSANGSSRWDAEAELTTLPPDNNRATRSGLGIRDSNYVSLEDVCYANQEGYSSKGTPQSSPWGNYTSSTATPAIFLQQGAKAKIQGIGGDEASFSLTAQINNQLAFYTSGWSCGSKTMYAGGWPESLQAMKDDSTYRSSGPLTNMWNLTASLSISFNGQIVKENSTAINSTGTPIPRWAEGYEVARTPYGTSNSGSATSDSATLPAASYITLLFAGFVTFWTLFA